MFTLSTDTSCDMPRNELRQRDVFYIPLTYSIEGITYEDEFCTDAEYSNFYSLIKGGALPLTSQITPSSHENYFCKLINDGAKEILHLSLSGGLSATYESAIKGAEEAKKQYPQCQIYVVDTINATQAHNYLLKKAINMRIEGKSALETSIALNYIKEHLQVFMVADDLLHLKRGGRVSAVSATVGTVLKIKPVLIINKAGGLTPIAKVKGMKKGLAYMVERLVKLCPNYKSADIGIAHADCFSTAQELYNLLKQAGCMGKIDIGWIGPVIGSHTGCGTIGLIFESHLKR